MEWVLAVGGLIVSLVGGLVFRGWLSERDRRAFKDGAEAQQKTQSAHSAAVERALERVDKRIDAEGRLEIAEAKQRLREAVHAPIPTGDLESRYQAAIRKRDKRFREGGA